MSNMEQDYFPNPDWLRSDVPTEQGAGGEGQEGQALHILSHP